MGNRIAIVGTGAVGGYAGSYMAQAGEDVTFIDMWPENVEAMRTKGLRITHLKDVAEFTVPVKAIHLTELQQVSKERPFDIAFVCTKSYDTAWATMMIKQYLAPGGYVVSLQNCMNEETIAGIVGWSFLDAAGKPVPVTKANIARLRWNGPAMVIANAAADLYGEAVMDPLVKTASASSPSGQSDASTSPTPPSGE